MELCSQLVCRASLLITIFRGSKLAHPFKSTLNSSSTKNRGDLLTLSVSMTQSRYRRFLLHPAAISSAFACVLVFVNLVPRVQVGLPVFFSPSSKAVPPCNGALEYGWPKVSRIDEFLQYGNFAPVPHYSIGHLLNTQDISVRRTERSALTGFVNAAFCTALVILVSLGIHVIRHRKFSLRALLLLVTLVGILFGSLSCGDSVTKTDHLKASLDWYSTEK